MKKLTVWMKCSSLDEKAKIHTTPGIRWSSATQLLVGPSLACLWESGRDPEFSSGYGRMCHESSSKSVLCGVLMLICRDEAHAVTRDPIGDRFGALTFKQLAIEFGRSSPTQHLPSTVN